MELHREHSLMSLRSDLVRSPTPSRCGMVKLLSGMELGSWLGNRSPGSKGSGRSVCPHRVAEHGPSERITVQEDVCSEEKPRCKMATFEFA